MSYKFHLCQPHRKCPNLTGWYMELRPDDLDTLMKIHKGVTGLYWHKFGMNPHIDPTGPYNPIKLAAQWLMSVQSQLATGETILVNMNGGIMPFDDTIILETETSDDLSWDVRFEDEIVTISKWFKGNHYWLSSSKGRIFVPDKYNTFESAYRAALRYVPVGRITSRC